MTDEVLMEDWREKPITAGELYDIFSRTSSAQNTGERVAAYIKKAATDKCRPLTPSEIDALNGFRHTCGGDVIGCRCRENWEFMRQTHDEDKDDVMKMIFKNAPKLRREDVPDVVEPDVRTLINEAHNRSGDTER